MGDLTIRCVVAASALACAGEAVQSGGVQLVRAEWGTVLSEAGGRMALQQCTRDAVDSLAAIWEPTGDDIQRLEQALGPVLETQLQTDMGRRYTESDTALRVTAADYYRQYVGVIIGARRKVYVNGFHKSWLELYGDVMRLTRDSSLGSASPPFEWRQRPVMVCDGGIGFFGVLYDVDSGAFEGFQFNGG